MIIITGPTATGKTRLAALLARSINAEIISADSRQVFKGMDIGSGKDLSDYIVDGQNIPYHLIDIVEAGTEFSVYQFVEHFKKAYENLVSRNKNVILCGGTGLYIQSIVSGYHLPEVPENTEFRKQAEHMDMEALKEMLVSMRKVHNTTDSFDRERLTRAVEIEKFKQQHPEIKAGLTIPNIIFGINIPRDIVRRRISKRLLHRLQNGMIEEVRNLLDSGISSERLEYYGLEYRYICQYLCKTISFEIMYTKLETSIHQFAKRQMTWFRRMEKHGHIIHWIDGLKNDEEKLNEIHQILATQSLKIFEKIES